jgi:translation initiation factor IF-2
MGTSGRAGVGTPPIPTRCRRWRARCRAAGRPPPRPRCRWRSAGPPRRPGRPGSRRQIRPNRQVRQPAGAGWVRRAGRRAARHPATPRPGSPGRGRPSPVRPGPGPGRPERLSPNVRSLASTPLTSQAIPGPRSRAGPGDQEPAALAYPSDPARRRRAGGRPVLPRTSPARSVPAWSAPGPAWPSAPWCHAEPGSCAPSF